MAKIEYNWGEGDKSAFQQGGPKLATRKNLQLARRFFHMGTGFTIATLYWFTLTHQQAVHTLGFIACTLYVLEQVRINYPQFANKFLPISRYIMRAEEQLKESAMVPYVFAVLLTIITFPKPLALVAIYTLAIADPLSAVVGISFGKHRIVKHKSVEGSIAFFIATFLISLGIFSLTLGGMTFIPVFISLMLALLTSAFEMIPIKLDDNLTIPLFTAITSWIMCALLGVVL